MNKLKLVAEIEVANTLGEGITWDQNNQCIWWTDILESTLYCWNFSGELRSFETPEPLCSFGLTHVPNLFIAAFSSGFAWFDPITQKVDWICKVESEYEQTRLNDGRVDRQGRFWAGTMDMHDGQLGSLYCLQNQHAVSKLSNLMISNGLCWNKSATVIYHADSPTRTIRSAQFEPVSGEIGEWQTFVNTNEGAFPDGSCVDSNDSLWNAQWGSSKVKRYSTTGEEVFSLDVPAKQPSCVTFGGPELSHLFVTTARVGLDDSELQNSPNSGNVFVYETPFKGLAESICNEKTNTLNLIKEVL